MNGNPNFFKSLPNGHKYKKQPTGYYKRVLAEYPDAGEKGYFCVCFYCGAIEWTESGASLNWLTADGEQKHPLTMDEWFKYEPNLLCGNGSCETPVFPISFEMVNKKIRQDIATKMTREERKNFARTFITINKIEQGNE